MLIWCPWTGQQHLLFLIPNPTTDPRQGYMPINGQCDFVFLNNVSAEGVARVAAHELGHGVFRLTIYFAQESGTSFLFSGGESERGVVIPL